MAAVGMFLNGIGIKGSVADLDDYLKIFGYDDIIRWFEGTTVYYYL
jgi:hypothetical protein